VNYGKSILNIFIKKLFKYSSIFYKLRNKLPSSCLRNIYYAFVHPHMLYGVELYVSTFSTYLKPSNVLINKPLRILQNCRLQTPVAHLYLEYQTLPINQLFILQILTLVHTFFYRNNELPEIYRDYFVINSTVHSHCTRQKSDYYYYYYIIINDSIYPAVSKASRTGNKINCQPNDCPNR